VNSSPKWSPITALFFNDVRKWIVFLTCRIACTAVVRRELLDLSVGDLYQPTPVRKHIQRQGGQSTTMTTIQAV
jgi:hypothetical protein